MLDGVEKYSQYKKDLKLMKKQGKDIPLLQAIIVELFNENPLPPHNKDHNLVGNYKGHRECHIQPDWLLIYKIRAEGEERFLVLVRTGTHSDLLE